MKTVAHCLQTVSTLSTIHTGLALNLREEQSLTSHGISVLIIQAICIAVGHSGSVWRLSNPLAR